MAKILNLFHQLWVLISKHSYIEVTHSTFVSALISWDCMNWFVIGDVGGQRTLRPYWRNYFEQNDGIVWVVDSSDRLRMEDCRAELFDLLSEDVRRIIKLPNALTNPIETRWCDSPYFRKQTGCKWCHDSRWNKRCDYSISTNWHSINPPNRPFN